MMSKGPLERRERLLRLCKSIVNNPRIVDDDIKAQFKAAALRYANTQYGAPEQVLKRLYCDEGELGDLMRGAVDVVVSKSQLEVSPATGALYPRTPRSFLEILDEDDDDARDDGDGDDDDNGDDDNGDIEKQAHHASVAADLLVESGRFPHRTAALHHLLNSPHGNALLARLHKAEAHTGKDHSTMDKTETLRDIAKAGGIIAVAKAIIDANRSYGITEHEFVELATEHAKAAHPELTEAAAFAKLYEIPEVWRACAVLKAAAPYFDPQVQVVGGADARNVDDPSEALAALHRIGRERWPDASEAIRFTRAFEANPELARKAHVRPSATSVYEFPR
jgi:hypothetical protein